MDKKSVPMATSHSDKQSEDSPLIEDDEEIRTISCCNTSYPKSILYIVGNEFCERFSYYGMRAILIIYFTQWLQFDDNKATALYHAFTMLCYFTPLVGAVIADGYLGKYNTILYLSIVYCIGNIVMSLTAIPPPESVGPIIGLMLISFGTGGIKPCVSSFGGDQFKLPEQEDALGKYFSIFYFMINVGSFLSTIITPVLRADVYCFNRSCFALAFGIPALLMIISLGLFVSGKRQYRIVPVTGNVIGKLFSSICHAIRMKWNKGSKETREHWIYFADDKYSRPFLNDVLAVLRVLWLFLPLPLFWALFDQQGSRWTLQAAQLNGDLGTMGVIRPDQMQALNALLILILIPIFDYTIYPFFALCGFLKRPLERMVIGGAFAAFSFFLAFLLQTHIESYNNDRISVDHIQLRVVNLMPCSVDVLSEIKNLRVDGRTVSEKDFPMASSNATFQFRISEDANAECRQIQTARRLLYLPGGKIHIIILSSNSSDIVVEVKDFVPKEPTNGGALVSVFPVYPLKSNDLLYFMLNGLRTSKPFLLNSGQVSPEQELDPGRYQLQGKSGTLTVQSGARYLVVLEQKTFLSVEEHSASQLSVLWQLPQYVVLTIGEILFSITGLLFAYSQAPISMKSVLQAMWFLTVAVGNVIVVVFAEYHLVPKQSMEFLIFSIMMTLDMFIFGLMAYMYIPSNFPTIDVGREFSDTMELSQEDSFPSQSRSLPSLSSRSEMESG